MAASPFGFGTAASQAAFGAAASTPAFSFSASSAASAFGASPAPAFGAASTPAFGAASAPAFGAPAASAPAPAFGFGQTTTALGAASSTPAFGSTFGATTPAFGAASSTPALGSAFGATPSAFGAASAPAFGGSLFGQQSAPAFGAASTPSLFGAASTPSLFGAAPAPAASAPAFGSVFAPAATSTTAGSIFGTSTALTPAQPQQPAALPGFTESGLGPDDAVRAIQKIQNAYDRNSPDYRFQHIFLNVVDNPAQRVKPPNVDEFRWRQAIHQAGGVNNPDRLWPAVAYGFKDLLARSRAQQAAIDENQQRLRSLINEAHKLKRRHETDLKHRMAEVHKRHMMLTHRLLHAARLVDSLESRFAINVGYNSFQARQKTQELSQQMSRVEAELVPATSTGLQQRLQAVAATARLRLGAPVSSLAQAQLDENSVSQLFEVLKEHVEAVKQLQIVLKKDQLDLEIMRKLSAGQESAGDVMMGMLS